MGHESQPNINVEELARQNPEAGNGLAGTLYAQGPADSALPKQNFSGAQSVLDKSIDKGGPLQIDGAAQQAPDATSGRPQTGPNSNRARMEELMKAHDLYHQEHRTLPIKREVPAFNPFTPVPITPNNRPSDGGKPSTPTVDQALQTRRTKLGDKVRDIGTANNEDASETKEHSGEMAAFKKLAKEQGVPLVVCITRTDDVPDNLPRPMKAGWETQAEQSKAMEKIMAELAQKEYGNALVVKMEACPSASTIAQQQLNWTLGKEGKGQGQLVVAPQVMVFLPNGQHHVVKHKTTLDEVTKLVRNK